MRVYFYTLAKKINSTAVPSSEGTAVECIVNEPCNIMNPVIKLRNTGSVPGWNYCKIPNFGNRFYWVDNWEYNDNCWFGSCSVDTLGTYRDNIINASLFFIRSSTEFDGDIVDGLYPSKATPRIINTFVEEGTFPATEYGFAQGVYVVGIVGSDGLTNYYSFSQPKFEEFCQKVFTNVDWVELSGQEITENLLKCMFNPFQYVTSCMWFPFPPENGVKRTEIKLGWWAFDIACEALPDKPFYRMNYNMPVSQHPDVSRGTYLNASPYRKIKLNIEPWGWFEIDGGSVGDSSSIGVGISVDFMSGMGILTITVPGREGYIYTDYTQVGLSLQVSDLRSNVIGAAGNVLSGIGGLLSFDGMGAINSIKDAVSSVIPSVTTSGVNSSMLSIARTPSITEFFYLLTGEDREDNGRPLFKNSSMRVLGNGFYVVENGRLSIARATFTELTNIQNYLESGVYYE